MVTYTIRFPYTTSPDDVQDTMQQAIHHIFQHHDSQALRIDCTLTANLVMKHDVNQQFSLFYGQDCGVQEKKSGLSLPGVYSLADPQDILEVPFDFETLDIVHVAQPRFDDSHLTIFEVANVIYILKFLEKNPGLNFRAKQSEIRLQDVV